MVSAGGVAFVLTFVAIAGYWAPGPRDRSDDCEGDACALELAAVLTWSLVVAVLTGATCAFVAFVLTRRRWRR
jgi:hypothetical protein